MAAGKWWCGTCGVERDISVTACPSCKGVVLTSLPLVVAPVRVRVEAKPPPFPPIIQGPV